MKHVTSLATATALAVCLGLALGPSGAGDGEKVIVAGLNSAIAITDPHFLIAQRDANFWPHVFETLYAVGEDMSPRPQLAVSHTMSDDGRIFTFNLRKNVRFHDGSLMTAADVLASWERFKRISPRAVNLAKVATMSVPNAETFIVELSEPEPNFIGLITGTAAPIAVLPAADGDKERGAISMVGTGPFRFVENVTDERTVIERFDDYSASDSSEGTDGYAGKRVALVDKVIFRAIPEGGTRISALQAGELTISDNLAVPASERLVAENGFVVQDVMPFSKAGVAVHSGQAPTDNILIRQAIQTALNAEEILEIALEGFYDLKPGYVFASDPHFLEGNVDKYYNAADPEAAKALLSEAGYAGEPLRIITNPNYPFMQNIALVMSEQLKAIGMTVEIETVDWATNLAALNNKDATWNLSAMGFGVPGAVGALSYWRASAAQYSHFGDDTTYHELSSAMLAEPDLEKRRDLWAQWERHVAEQAYILPLGDRGMKVVSTDDIEGYKPFYSMRFWNVEMNN